MGGGILPAALVNKKLKFLFGKEVQDKKWSDFGGGREGNETPFDTAIREGCEELDGFFGCSSSLRKLVKSNQIGIIDTQGLKTYIFLVEYDENLPIYFNNHHHFIKKHLPYKINRGGLFEKSEIGWFSSEELKHSPGQFRPFYRNVVKNIVDNYSKLLKNAKKI